MEKPSGHRTAADYLQDIVDQVRAGELKVKTMNVYSHAHQYPDEGRVISKPNGTYTLQVRLAVCGRQIERDG